jgi:hypothetical protein
MDDFKSTTPGFSNSKSGEGRTNDRLTPQAPAAVSKYFVLMFWYRDGEHEHLYRGVMRGRSEKDVLGRADKAAIRSFAFGDEDDAEDAVSIWDCREISEAEAHILLQVGGMPDLDEDPQQ